MTYVCDDCETGFEDSWALEKHHYLAHAIAELVREADATARSQVAALARGVSGVVAGPELLGATEHGFVRFGKRFERHEVPAPSRQARPAGFDCSVGPSALEALEA